MEPAKNCYINTAQLYDLGDNLAVDIKFYIEYGKNQNGEILDLGCGTGRVSIELAKAGFYITGLDLSKKMLNVFKDKLYNLPSDIQNRIDIINGDMSNFKIDKKYSLIITPFRSFQLLTNKNDINNCLNCIKNHLDVNGIFIINVFRPDKRLDESWCYGETIQWERDDPKNDVHVIKKNKGERIDIKRQIIYPKYIYEIKNKEVITEKYIENLELRYYYYEELKETLLNSGFTILEEYGWYDRSGIENGMELIMVCK